MRGAIADLLPRSPASRSWERGEAMLGQVSGRYLPSGGDTGLSFPADLPWEQARLQAIDATQ
jgi:hypothetical protein